MGTDEEIRNLEELYPNSRLLLVCQSCFKLKPSIVVELKENTPCSWCFKSNLEENVLLLLETTSNNNVEYDLIRKCGIRPNTLVTECQKNLGIKWKPCPNGENCPHAHNKIEWKIWNLENKYTLERSELVRRFRNSTPRDRNLHKGVFHCVVCSKNLSTGKEFAEHCESDFHKLCMRSASELVWKHRPLPETDQLILCELFQSGTCEDGESCSYAHSVEELEEWKKRWKLNKEKLKYASETGLLSFQDSITQEYETSSSCATVWKDHISGVRVKSNYKYSQRVAYQNGDNVFAWRLKIHCFDPTEKLNHACFISPNGGRKKLFRICRFRRGKRSKLTSHLNFRDIREDECSLNLYGGDGTYEVKFLASSYGSYDSSLVLEFRNSPRPALKIDFHVEVISVRSCWDLLLLPNREKEEIVSWEAKKEIIRWEEENENDYSKALQTISKKYKNPDVSLEYTAERLGKSVKHFDPHELSLKDYVKEMHNFLYREEKARSKRLDKVRSFYMVFTNCYKSTKSGTLFCMTGQLYAIFELPVSLSRDTDEGLLILDSCKKVLVGKRRKPSSPVYEALITEKFIDHIVLLMSPRCVKDWSLTSGEVLDAVIQFQFDREKFCRCHYALDQLQKNKQLSLVCPNPSDCFLADRTSTFNSFSSDLDADQKRVLAFLESKNVRTGKTLPLFLMQGSFGTGKTYTICKCIKSLLQHDANAKILICTHSNSAADLYILNNFREVKQWKNKVIRVLYHGRNVKSVPPTVMEYCLFDGKQFLYPTAQDVASRQVFIATFETALCLGSLGTSLKGCFTHIFLDEVAQVMEPAAIIPLTLANSETTKVVIAGDHKQMTEKIYSKENGMIQNDSDFTLLSRMFKIYSRQLQNIRMDYPERHQHDFLVALRNNYRCAPEILTLIQSLFYKEGLLEACSGLRPLPGLKPIQFHDIQGTCVSNALTGGYYNDSEAAYIADMVENLLRTYPSDLQETDIAVVASYQDQVQFIRSRLRRQKKLHQVKVETVRNVQGLEYKIVILSCVHKRETKEHTDGEKFGLLSDRDVLNTAFTRTKLAIIAVGHAVTLWTLGQCGLMWNSYIRHCSGEGGLFPLGRTAASIQLEATMNNYSDLNPHALEFKPGGQPLPAPSPNPQALSAAAPAPADKEDDLMLDETQEEEETLPLRDDILDEIVRNIVGIKPGNIVIKVDKSGKEIVTEQESFDDSDRSVGSNEAHGEFSLDHLQTMLHIYPREYKKCTLLIKRWYLADAVVQDPDDDVQVIRINTKRNLGRSFDRDEVVVHIEKKIQEKESDSVEEKLVSYGKVVGILSRYRDPAEIKFICVPDLYNPNFMCPIDKKVTKFVIEGREGMRRNNLKIPICELKKKDGKDSLEKVESVRYDRFSMTLEKSKHFVVRFIKWPPLSLYPVGYVSEEIQPKNFDKYYTLLHDVPSETHKKSVDRNAATLANQPLKEARRDLSDLYVFTIDPEGSTDLDDAMSLDRCKEHDNCWKIGIHIADVASVVPADSDVDLEAKKRATSFYSGDVDRNRDRKVVHMLPDCLSSRKCSLRADGRKRPTISIFLHSAKLPVLNPLKDKTDKVLNLPTPELTYVTSRRQMTYREAEDCLREVRRNGEQRIDECNEHNIGDQLYVIWKVMLHLRFQRIDWSSFYAQPDFNEFNKFCDEASAHMLIEEAMITCNSCCSHFLKEKNCDFLLRTQNPPLSDDTIKWREDNMESISLSLHQQGCLKNLHGEEVIRQMENEPKKASKIPVFPHVWLRIGQALSNNDLDTALILFSCDKMQPALTPGHSGYLWIQSKAALKSRSEVNQSTTPGSVTHFSLRLTLYSWFTSPIRRYTDIQGQRLILEKIATSTSVRDPNVIEISQPKAPDLIDLGKKLMRRSEDAKLYEKDGRNFSYALGLSHDQNYEAASISEVNDSGVSLELVDLRNLPPPARTLRYSNLRLATQTEGHVSWRMRYFNVGEYQQNCILPHTFFTSTVVSSSDWSTLLRSVKSLVFGNSLNEPISERSENLLKNNFAKVLRSQTLLQVCNRNLVRRNGPCDNDECRRRKVCHDYLDGRSKIGIYHYRVITMPLSLGTPLLVQLYCDVQRGICVPSVQLLTLSQDLDLCIAHNRSPVETFAADLRPILIAGTFVKGEKPVVRFKAMEKYTNYWLPLLRMDGVYNSVKDNSNSTTLQNVPITFDVRGSRLRGSFSLSHAFRSERMIRFHDDDFVCIRVKCFNPAPKGDDSKMNEHKRSFTWVVHARLEGTREKRDDKINFTACMSLVGDANQPKLPTAIDPQKKGLRATVEVIQLGASHRGIANALHILAACAEDDRRPLSNQDILMALCLEDHVPRPYSPVSAVERAVGTSVVPGMRYPLNEGQVEQIREALTRKISMIQGPPGTGKSFVGAHLAYYFVKCNRENQGRNRKILYCGPSNKSVDVVAEYLLRSKMKVLRVYGNTFEEKDYPNPLRPKVDLSLTEKKPSDVIRSITLHQIIRRSDKPYASQICEYDRKFANNRSNITMDDYVGYHNILTKAKFKEFLDHDVIICTCSTAAVLRDSLSSTHNREKVRKAFGFAQCIIDECGMCSEPETIAPIVASKANQVVLIGDHMQLQPIIQCAKAKELGLDVSLFERRKEKASKLTRQYRMNPGICDFPSHQFYEGDLTTDESVLSREGRRSFRFCYPPESPNTAVFCHVVGQETVNFSLDRGGENSFYNELEARVVIKILFYFYRNGVPLSNIMILTPYSAQVSTIRNLILEERSQLKDVHVGTVVTSQGSESDFVILSTVRSRPQAAIENHANLHWRRKFIGFVADPHQINVGITRAKSGLCIVGNRNLLEKDTETWAKLLENYGRKNSIVYCDAPEAPWNRTN